MMGVDVDVAVAGSVEFGEEADIAFVARRRMQKDRVGWEHIHNAGDTDWVELLTVGLREV